MPSLIDCAFVMLILLFFISWLMLFHLSFSLIIIGGGFTFFLPCVLRHSQLGELVTLIYVPFTNSKHFNK